MNFPSKQVMTRYVVVTIVLGLVCLCVLARVFYIITVDYDYWMDVRKEKYNKQDWPLPATRGNILAADGQLLAGTLPQYRMSLDFMSWEKKSEDSIRDQMQRDFMLCYKLDSICEGMARIFPDVKPAEFRKLLLAGRRRKTHYCLLYPRRVSYIKYLEVKNLPLFRLPRYRSGFVGQEYLLRKKPFGNLAARTIGDLYGEAIEENEGLKPRSGLELTFDSVLRGKPGLYRWKKTRNVNLPEVIHPAEAGSDIQTTLDVGMQDICEKALGDRLRELPSTYAGVCILMEVATGDIKAITSLSQNAHGDFVERTTAAVSNLYEPGSVFKPVSFMVAMDDGLLKMSDGVDVGSGQWDMHGSKMKDHNWRKGGYRRFLNLSEILQKSSNIGVSVLIDRVYQKDPAKFVDGLYRVGIAEDLKVPLPGYTPPRIRRPKADGSNWSKTALPWMSIGYETQVPPISTVTFYNGVANGGKMMRPRLVKAVLRNGEVVREYPADVLREQMCKPEVVRNIQQCLEDVVSIGTGKAAGSPKFKVAGKTGTAQIWTRAGLTSRYLVSFAGFFPADKPLYSCIVCMERSGHISGGLDCGPVFRRVAETVMAQSTRTDVSGARDTLHALLPMPHPGNLSALGRVLNRLGIDYDAPASLSDGPIVWGTVDNSTGRPRLKEEPCGEGLVPDVKGYGLRDALFRLEKAGLRVRVQGTGRVSRQSLPPGSRFRKGDTVVLTLGRSAGKPLPHAAEPTDSLKKNAEPGPENAGAGHTESADETGHSGQRNGTGGKEKPKSVPPHTAAVLADHRKRIRFT